MEHVARLTKPLVAIFALAALLATVACSQAEPVAAPTVVPQPTAPPVPAIDPAALSSMVQQAVQGAVTEAVQQVSASSSQDMEAAISRAMTDLPTGVSAADMQAAVNSAIATLPAGVSAADVEAAIRKASAEAPAGVTAAQMEAAIRSAVATQPQPASASEIQRMVETAVSAAAAPGATRDEVKALVDAAMTAASAQAVTKEEIQELVAKAVASEVAKSQSVTAGDVEKIVSSALAMTAVEAAGAAPVGIQPGTSVTIPQAIADFYTLNPLLTDQSVEIKMTNVIEPLLTFDKESLAIRPLLAQSWEVSDDGTEYTFNLRDDVRWHDGVEFTSEDVKFTVEAAILPTTKFKYLEIWEKIGEVQTPDKYTVKFILDEPFSPLLMSFIQTGMIPKHLNEDYIDNMLEAPYAWQPVGTGPYIITEHTDELLTMTANPDYWGEKARIEKVYWRDTPPGATGRVLLETGAVDMSSFDPDTMTDLIKTGNYRVLRPSSTANTAVMHINLLDPLFEDKRVRQALLLGFDREAAIKTYGRPAMVMHSAITPGIWAYNEDATKYEYDPDRAVGLLEEVGWTKNADGKLVNASGEPFKFTITHVPWGGLKESGVVAHQNWNELGMEVELQMTSDWSTWVTNVWQEKKFQVGMMGWSMGIDPGAVLPTHYKCGATSNLESWCNDEVDRLMDEINVATDPATRKGKLDRFQEIFTDELPRLPVMHRLWEFVIDDKLRGIFLPTIPSPYFKMNEWYWER